MIRRVLRGGVLDAVERVTGLTGSGLLLLIGALAAIAGGAQFDSAGLTILGYTLGLALALVWVLSRRKVPVTGTRTALPRRVTLGRSVSAELGVTSTRRLTSVVVNEAFPRSLWRPMRVAVPVLPAGQPVTHAYDFIADRRGTYQVGPMTLERTDPFGLVRSRQEIAPAESFIVHPRREPVVDRILTRAFEDPVVRPPHSRPWPTGAEFYGMRPYESGDDPRRIVWRAVARHDDLLVREAEHGVTDSVCLMVDTSVHSWSWHDDLSLGFEQAVCVAASVGSHHLEHGFSVTLESNTASLVGGLRGKQDRIELLDALAALEPDAAGLGATIDRLLRSRSVAGHHVVVTGDLTPEATKALRTFLDRGHTLLIVLVVDEGTDPMTIAQASALRCQVLEVHAAERLQRPFTQAATVRPR